MRTSEKSLLRFKHSINTLLLLSVCLSLFVIQGCTVGPDYEPPELTVPDAWNQKITDGLATGDCDDRNWWEGFNDPVLTGLIEKAVQGNLDVQQAALRIQQTRSMLDIADGTYDPQVDAVGSYSRSRQSENSPFYTDIIGDPDQINVHSVGLDASWEIDIFGRIKRSVESATATHQASIENYRDVLVSLYAEIAINYAELRSLQKRITYAQQNIETQHNTLGLTQNRYEAELAPKLDVEQARLNLANTEAFVPDLRILENNALNRLAVLTGQYPGSLLEDLKKSTDIPSHTGIVKVGLPTDLIRQRPDIRQAERQLASQVAEIGVAKADLYPAFSLSGTFGFESTNLSDLGDMSSRTWGFGPSMRWNIFAGGRVRSNIQLQQFLADESYVRYEQTVLHAVEEVENAIVEYTQKNIRTNALAKSVTASKESERLVTELYINGLTDFQNVLDMQRTLSQQQDKLAQSQGEIIKSLVRIYKSMGGGWMSEQKQQAQLCDLAEPTDK